MRYLEQLLEQFSDAPRNIVIKADVLTRGMRITPDLEAAGATACTTGLSNKVARSISQSPPPPSQFHFRADDTTVDIKPGDTSPYRIECDDDGRHQLYSETQALGEVYFTPRPAYMDRHTSDGKPCDEYLTQRGPSCLWVEPISFCAFVKKGEACGYCLLGPAMELRIRQKLARPIPDFEMVAEAVDIAWEELDLRELKLSGGALYDTHQEARLHIECLETILARVSAPEEITIFSQALAKDDQKRLKDAGATNVCFDLEVWNEDLWDRVLPGKAKAVSRKEWMKRLDDAVDVFGRGHVGSNFVSGFECAPRPGFLSQEEALKSYAEGFRELVERGVVPWFTIWNAHPLVGGFQASDPPPTDFHLKLGAAIHELLEKHGVYRDLGFPELGVDPETLGLYCYYCYTMQFTRDYPRLIGREASEPPAAAGS
jgi:hypothetical protein